MTQPFILEINPGIIYDDVSSQQESPISFLSQSYQVMDGGFDIGLPETQRTFGMTRPGFYRPTKINKSYRKATIRFAISGVSRSSLLQNLHYLRRTLSKLDALERVASGQRMELKYAWGGATQINHFEIYGADLLIPPDVLSVEKMHKIINGRYVIPDFELTLYISPMGYSVSIYSDPIELPIYNTYVGSKRTGGVKVVNAQTNWVRILGSDIDGDTPVVTKLSLTPGSTYSDWHLLYAGITRPPYPGKIIYDSAEIVYGYGSVLSGGYGGNHRRFVYNGAASVDFFSAFAWEYGDSIGMFHAFYHGYSELPTTMQLAVGIDDYVTWGIRWHGDWVKIPPGYTSMPMGVIQLPPTPVGLANKGILHEDLWLGVWFAYDGPTTGTLDYISLLPIKDGLRVWRYRSDNKQGDLIDDGWDGLEYLKDSRTGKVWSPFYGLMEPLRLYPGVDQRIYFTSVGGRNSAEERNRMFNVRVYYVPTYETLAY